MSWPFVTRNAIEQGLRALGVHEIQARQAAFAGPGGFDLTQWPRKKTKAYAKPRPLPNAITVHVTDVRGGFGVSRRRVSHWQGECNDWRDVPGWAEAMDGEKWVAEAMYLADFEYGEAAQRLALWERLAEQAYHQIGAANGDVLAIRDVTEHSWHASEPLNRQSCGWALDCHHSEPLDEWLVETGKASLRALIHRMLEARPGRGPAQLFDLDDSPELDKLHPVEIPGPILVRPHRANDSQRRVDPQGNHERGVWRDVVVPVVESEPDAEIDYEWSNAKRGGRPVPRVWDDRALYDWKGRKL